MDKQITLADLQAENLQLTTLLEAPGILWRMPAAASQIAPAETEPSKLRTAEKIALFRRLFQGRTDVYPVRWESKTSGKSGYAPACAYEWRSKLITELEALPPDAPRVLLATGKLTGEGFDYPPLDTLVLAMPISWKGNLQQYAGRLHREHATKTDVRIIDCVDTGHPGAATHVGQTPARLSCHGPPDSGAIGVERTTSSGITRYRQ